MTKQEDLCPLNDSGYHRYFIFKTVEVFEPFGKDLIDILPAPQLYEKIEYALMGCNCGSAIKRKVQQ